MSKRRRNKKKPNLPQATLDRARREAGLEPAEPQVEEAAPEPEVADDPKADVEESQPEPAAAKASTSSTGSRSTRRRRVNSVQLDRNRKKGELDAETVAEMLANPTVEVTEEELGKDYRHVLLDLRNMGVLAAVLMVLLVGLAQFL